MTDILTLPRMGETMESGRIAAWLKRPGDRFVRGETLVEVETDKVTVEMPALDSGRLTEILAPEGAEVAVGAPLGRYEPEGADPAAAAAPSRADPGLPPTPASASSPEESADPVAFASPAERPRATPLARRLARRAGLDLSALQGTGRRHRIEARDVEAVTRDGDGGRVAEATVTATLPELLFVTLPQGRMAYRQWGPAEGARRKVLLLHGFAADGVTWAGFAAHLARSGARVIVPDLPGHGATGIEARGFDDLVGTAAAFAEVAGLGGAEVVGHSMGGAAALRLAASGRIAPPSLTLIAPAGLGREIDADFVTGMAAATTGGALAHLLRRLARRPPHLSQAQLAAMAREVGRGRLEALAAELVADGHQAIDAVADLRAMTAPVRLVWGLEDRIIPWTHAAAAPSRVAIHLIADAGHMPGWDRPQDLAALFA